MRAKVVAVCTDRSLGISNGAFGRVDMGIEEDVCMARYLGFRFGVGLSVSLSPSLQLGLGFSRSPGINLGVGGSDEQVEAGG